MTVTLDLRSLSEEEQHDLIDGCVHLHVMKQEPRVCEGELMDGCGFWQCGDCGLQGDWSGKDFDERWSNHLALPPKYSTDWNAAWRIFERYVSGHFWDTGGDETVTQKDSDFVCELVEQSGRSPIGEIYPAYSMVSVVATWTPRLLCLAGLKAEGIEVLTSDESDCEQ